MTLRDQLNDIADQYPDSEMLTMDGYDDCVVGVVTRFGQDPIFCYDLEKVIGKLVGMGMTREEAEEYYGYNQLGAWMGDGTPCFLHRLEDELG